MRQRDYAYSCRHGTLVRFASVLHDPQDAQRVSLEEAVALLTRTYSHAAHSEFVGAIQFVTAQARLACV